MSSFLLEIFGDGVVSVAKNQAFGILDAESFDGIEKDL